MLDINLWGTIITCREAVKHFGNDGGSIINIGSMSSERFSAGAVAYTASKAGITGVTGVLAVELASRGIRVNQINPGAVDTEGARAIGAMSDEARAAHIARTPLGRVGTPADIASVAVFLASDEAGWLTGECLAVSGGLRERRPKQQRRDAANSAVSAFASSSRPNWARIVASIACPQGRTGA